jgi:CelD/BcsL family acetyltransferase involved in cellulose biosynthesis
VGLRVEVCETPEAFRMLKDPWSILHQGSASRSLFMTWEWLEAWWNAYGAASELRAVCVYDGRTLVGAAPLVRSRRRYYGMSLVEVAFVGDGASDRQCFLDATSDGAATSAIWEFILENPFGASILRLEQLPRASPTVTWALAQNARLQTEESSRLPFLRLEGGWAAYEASLSRRFRSEMRTRHKVFASFGSWECRHVRGSQAVEMLPALAAVEAASGKLAKGKGFLADPRNLALLRDFGRMAAPPLLECVASLLSIGGTLVAYLFGMVFDHKYHAYTMAYLPQYAKGSPGKYVMHETIRWAFENGLAEFDFLRGEFQMKENWKPDSRANWRAVGFFQGLRPQFMRWLVFGLRPRLKVWFGRG